MPTTIGQKPSVNNLLAPNIRAIDLRISPRAIAAITSNNFKNPNDGSFGMKHLKNVHKPSHITHLKTNGGQQLKPTQTNSYPRQRCAKANS